MPCLGCMVSENVSKHFEKDRLYLLNSGPGETYGCESICCYRENTCHPKSELGGLVHTTSTSEPFGQPLERNLRQLQPVLQGGVLKICIADNGPKICYGCDYGNVKFF